MQLRFEAIMLWGLACMMPDSEQSIYTMLDSFFNVTRHDEGIGTV